MESCTRHVRAALRQQFESDRLLGVKSVPIRLESLPRESVARVQPAASAQITEIDAANKAERLRRLYEDHVRGCKRCSLCDERTQTVFGQGSPTARLVFVGEAPGAEEDRTGQAFVGRAGQLLTRMIAAMGLSREEVYICNVLKCRPPGNRNPAADEILACSPYLREQLAIIHPEVLVALGAPAAKTLLNTAQAIGKLRGRFQDYDLTDGAGQAVVVPVLPTYHPAYLLRNPAEKRKAWDDLQMVMDRMGLMKPLS
ncbi:MAG: uracil-DNA glycosylase [Planctomycetes bacterium]|nr:uracil-DNA glycosylase [Planctomycetota bacterium]